jgi:hypothetical protein
MAHNKLCYPSKSQEWSLAERVDKLATARMGCEVEDDRRGSKTGHNGTS